jgi:flagellar hook-associated protein 3 FlgL
MIGRITDQMTSQLILNDLNSSLDQLDNTQTELASGRKLNQPSDDPYGTSLAMQLNGDLSALNSYSNNINDGTSWATAGQSALSNIQIFVETSNSTNNQSDLNAAAAEVDQLIDQVKQEADTQYGNEYIFSGTATGTQPYATGTGSSDTYAGNGNSVNRLIGPSTTVSVNVNISTLLGSGQTTPGQPAGDGLLLNTLRNISDDLKSGNTAALSGADQSQLQSNLNGILSAQASLGAVTDRLQLATTRIQDLQTNDTQVLSNTEDADMAQTEINYSTEQAAFTAALKASAGIVQSSLVNFLGPSA